MAQASLFLAIQNQTAISQLRSLDRDDRPLDLIV